MVLYVLFIVAFFTMGNNQKNQILNKYWDIELVELWEQTTIYVNKTEIFYIIYLYVLK